MCVCVCVSRFVSRFHERNFRSTICILWFSTDPENVSVHILPHNLTIPDVSEHFSKNVLVCVRLILTVINHLYIQSLMIFIYSH